MLMLMKMLMLLQRKAVRNRLSTIPPKNGLAALTPKKNFYDFMESQICRKTFNKSIDKIAFLWYNTGKGFGYG